MEFPRALFPGFYNEGPAVQESPVVSTLGWGAYSRVQEDFRDPGQRRFIPLYSRTAERWETTEPAPVPLLPPNDDCGFLPVTESDLIYKKVNTLENTVPRIAGVSLHFSEQVSRFCWDQSSIAFQSMGRLLEPHFYLGEKNLRGKDRIDQIKMTNLLQCLQNMPYHECPFPYNSYPVRALSLLTGDWMQDVPPAVLAQLVNDGMADEWKQLQFKESVTGGALSWAPYAEGSTGCLIYPRGPAMNQLYFQQILLKPSRVKIRGEPAVFDLQQRVLQTSTGAFDSIFVGVRSAYNVAAWSFSADDPPRSLAVVRTKTPSTCVNVSPHLPGELCVCTERGTLYLWNLERGFQPVRQDEETLFFRDDARWRWSDFTSHPRVLLYTDRTGVQAADVRVNGAQGSDLFRIGRDSSCQKGERVIISRCLRETNSAQFLVTTQFSVYIMDERCPLVPLAKWSHMLERPPSFVSVVPGGGTNKILLGTQHSQETVLLQYSGGNCDPCQLHLPTVKFPRSAESLHYLDPLIPHHRDIATQRVASPMAGLATACTTYNPESMMVFLLTEAGDVFTQQLVHKESPASSSSREGHVSTGHTVNKTAPSRTSAERTSEDVTVESEASGQQASGRGEEGSPEPGSSDQIRALSPIHEVGSTSAQSFSTKSKLSFHKWIRSLLKLCKGSAEGLRRPGCPVNRMFSAAELREVPQEVEGLRECLRQSMKTGKLIKLPPPTPPESVERVCTETWKDPLSQRLSAAWDGQIALWWDDYLGLNKLSKIQALREKRRRQKLQRARSQSSLTGSFLSSFSFGSDVYDTQASSPWSHDSAPASDADTTVHSAVSETQGSIVSIDQRSTWSFQSGPSRRSDLFRDRQAHPQASSELSSQILSEPSVITSSQSLRSKGIPKERRRTLQEFISFFGESRDAQTSDPTQMSQEVTPSQSSERLSRSFQPGTSSQRPQTPTPSTPSKMPTRTQLSQGTFSQSSQTFSQRFQPQTFSQSSQMQTFSQRSALQSRSRRPPAKKFQMGF